ncbi:MAG TPA: xanthine dehydrogenase [Actinomycetota bacterium]|nr:xanthine dehydrogenase [Actinomycetota bacterium]
MKVRLDGPGAVIVRGSGDVGSAIAHRLFSSGYRVVIHDGPSPSAPRRGMAFTDAVFDGSATLEGVEARRVDDPAGLVAALAGRAWVPVCVADLEAVLAAVPAAVLVDARMRKRATPQAQIGLAPLTIGVGPNFVAGQTTDLVIETSWGDQLGTVITAGRSLDLAGEPRTYGGHARDRFVYAPAGGVFRTGHNIAEVVEAGEVIATLDGAELVAPLPGILRGLVHDGVTIAAGTKCIEVDPRGDPAFVRGIGERPGAIARGVRAAIEGWPDS